MSVPRTLRGRRTVQERHHLQTVENVKLFIGTREQALTAAQLDCDQYIIKSYRIQGIDRQTDRTFVHDHLRRWRHQMGPILRRHLCDDPV
jgi:hypothetical protein